MRGKEHTQQVAQGRRRREQKEKGEGRKEEGEW